MCIRDRPAGALATAGRLVDGSEPPRAPTPAALRAALDEIDPELRRKLARHVWEQRAGAPALATRLAARMLLRASERLGRLSAPGVADGQVRDEVFIAIASVGKAATTLTAAQLDALGRPANSEHAPDERAQR